MSRCVTHINKVLAKCDIREPQVLSLKNENIKLTFRTGGSAFSIIIKYRLKDGVFTKDDSIYFSEVKVDTLFSDAYDYHIKNTITGNSAVCLNDFEYCLKKLISTSTANGIAVNTAEPLDKLSEITLLVRDSDCFSIVKSEILYSS